MALPNLLRLAGSLIALGLFVFPGLAQDQKVPGMTEEDRMARCANNRARLDELNKAIIDSQPMGASAIKQANDDLIEIGTFAAKSTFLLPDIVLFSTMAYRYGFNPDACLLKGIKDCGAELGILIHKQLEDSATRESGLAALKAQAAKHEANLVALRCTEGVLDVVGDWDTDWGTLTVSSTVGGFTATYGYATGGRISGSFDGHKVDAVWAHTLSQRKCAQEKLGTSYWGRLVLNFADDGKSFSGNWSYCDDPPRETWNGTRAPQQP